jgi:transcriptional regulator with XRE-family HTH domain
MGDSVNTDLGRYLRSVRERTRPEAIGLPRHGQRRVPGLRREEVAALAGISPNYYTRLEQAQDARPSPSVLRAIARALELSAADEAYLFKVGTAAERQQCGLKSSGELSPYTTMLVNSLQNAAVAVVDYRCDILAWNPLYHRLFAPHLDPRAPTIPATRPNVIRMNFLDERVRRIYVDRALVATSNVAYLRFVAADHQRDRELAALVEELVSCSDEFARLWRSHTVENCTSGRYVIEHASVGRLHLMHQAADLRDGNVIKFYHAEPSTPDEAALRLLASEPAPSHEFAIT